MTAVGAERVLRGCPWLQKLGNIPDLGRAVAAAARGETSGRAGGRRGSATTRGRPREDRQAQGRQAADDDARERDELQLRSFRSDRPPPLAVVAEHCPRLDDITICLLEDAEYCECLREPGHGGRRRRDARLKPVCSDRIPCFAELGRSVPGLARLRVSCEDGVTNDVMAELLHGLQGQTLCGS